MRVTIRDIKLLMTGRPTTNDYWIDAALATMPRMQVRGKRYMEHRQVFEALRDYCARDIEFNRRLIDERAGQFETTFLGKRVEAGERRMRKAAELLAMSEDEITALYARYRAGIPKQTQRPWRKPPLPASPNAAANPDVYRDARIFVGMVRQISTLTEQQKRTLIGQAYHGDLEGARKGLDRLMGRG